MSPTGEEHRSYHTVCEYCLLYVNSVHDWNGGKSMAAGGVWWSDHPV